MKAIIPAAGMGTRLRPHTYALPKVLVNVGGKPILSHIIDQALSSGIDDIALIIGYKGEMVKEYVESNYTFKCAFYHQEATLGIAHAVGLADEYLDDEPVFIILGDTIFEIDIKPVFSSEYSALGVKVVENPRRFGVAELDRDGFITRLVEKPDDPRSNLALVGLYYLKSGRILKDCINEVIRKNITTKDEFQITDALQLMIDRGEKITTFEVAGWYDCGKHEAVLATNRHLLSKIEQDVHLDGSVVREPVYIDPSATIRNSIIGPYATIATNAAIRNSIIVNSIIGEKSSVADIYLKDSMVGSNAEVTGSLQSVNICDYSYVIL